MTVFYNDTDRRACATLREMIADGIIADGDVDGRDVATIQPRELSGYNRVHLFAGIGGFEIAARLAGWPDSAQLWTGGFPCTPFSVAGRRKGAGDDRYLWPEFERLIRGCRPEFVLIENVAAIDSEPDLVLDRVLTDLEALDYETWSAEIPACAVDAAHERNRVWVMAHRAGERWGEGRARPRVLGGRADASGGCAEPVAHCHQPRPQERRGVSGNAGSQRAAVERGGAGAVGDHDSKGIIQQGRTVAAQRGRTSDAGIWGDFCWIACHDGRFRRIPLGLLDPAVVLADGLPSRTLALHGLGNSIVPQVAAEVLRAACPS